MNHPVVPRRGHARPLGIGGAWIGNPSGDLTLGGAQRRRPRETKGTSTDAGGDVSHATGVEDGERVALSGGHGWTIFANLNGDWDLPISNFGA